jgi:hypothetical protein
MQRLEVSGAVRHIYTSLGGKGLSNFHLYGTGFLLLCSKQKTTKPQFQPLEYSQNSFNIS